MISNTLQSISYFRNYISFLRKYSFSEKRLFPDLEKERNHLLSGFERFSLLISWLSFSLLHLFELSSSSLGIQWHNILIVIMILFLVIIINKYIEYFDNITILPSITYILFYLLLSYYPGIFNIPLYARTDGDLLLLSASFIIVQTIRPGKTSGIPVISFIILHYTAIEMLSSKHWSVDTSLHILFLVWAGLLVLLMEFMVFFTITGYIDIRTRKKTEKADLILARKVYHNLFPDFRENEFVRIFSFHHAENNTGGDFFDIIQLREKNIGIFLTDISGHGISSTVMSAAIKGIISSMPYRHRLHPENFLTELDHRIADNYDSHHASAVYIHIDFRKEAMQIGNAGHCPVLLSRGGKPFKEIKTKGSVLGYRIADPIARMKNLKVRAGDRIVLYTDGLTEYLTDDGNVETVDDFEKVISGTENYNGDELIDAILRKIETRKNFESYRDDVMILIVEVLKTNLNHSNK